MAGDRRVSRPDASLPDWEVPDSAYRPVPIVWFTGAMIGQLVVLFVLYLMLIDRSGWITIAMATLATLLIAGWTWERGMKGADSRWRIATAVMLVLQLAFVCLGATPRL